MRCPLCRIPAFRRLRDALARILALCLLFAVAACDQARDPVAPEETVGEGPSAADPGSVGLATLGTSRIAFMINNDDTESSDIWTIGPGGGGLSRLTSWSGSEWDPTWSYDHQRLAMVRVRPDANNVLHSDIFLMNADGSNKRWARSTPYVDDMMEPSWSPDGKRLVVTLRLQSVLVLATLELSTGNLVLVAPKGVFGLQGRYASYDPTGKSIIYLSALDGAVHRFVPGGADEILVASPWQIGGAALSPDGTKLAYSRLVTTTNYEIFVLTLATHASKRLTFNAAEDSGPTWSPDGTRLAFLSRRSGSYQVWTMNAATGGSLTQVTKLNEPSSPAWAH